MIESQFSVKHWLLLGFLVLAIIIASIQPLELSSYILHQIGTVLMLIALFICFKKIGLNLYSFTLYIGFLLMDIVGAH